jgi:hypothetical protein
MAQQLINVGASPNDGQGNPIRTSFIKCNQNFSELYARAQTTPPPTLVGSVGDFAGMYAYDSTYFYYCFANYDGSSVIWAQVTQIGNISVTSINNANSNVEISGLDGPALVNINGVSNVAVFTEQGEYVTGLISATGNVIANYIFGNGSQLTGIVADYGNTNVASYLTTYGGNILADSIDFTGNITGVDVSVTGNITGNYILGNGSQLTGLPATYNNANVVSLLSAFGSNSISTTGNVTSDNLSAAGNISGGANITATGVVSATGNIVTSSYFIGNFQGNITGNFVVPGSNTQVLFNTNGNADASAGLTFDTSGPNLLTLLGNLQADNVRTAGVVSATGNVTGNYILGNGAFLTGVAASYGNSNVVSLLSAFGSNTLSTTGNVSSGNLRTTGSVSATGNIIGGNINATAHTGTTVSVNANITGGNILTAGIVSSVGNGIHGNILTSGLISASGNIIGGRFIAGSGNISGGNLSVTVDIAAGANISANAYTGITTSVIGNVTGGNLKTAGQVSASGNVTGGNLLAGGSISATGNINLAGAVSAIGNLSGNYIIGNGSLLTGLMVDSTQIQNGNSNVKITTASGNISISVNNVSPVSVITPLGINLNGTFEATGNITGNNLFVNGFANISGNTNVSGRISATGNVLANNISVNGIISATGNILGANLIVTGNIVDTGALSIQTGSNGNLTLSPAGSGAIIVNADLLNGQANGLGNIGSAGSYFNTVFAQATSAQYADLAEIYASDRVYDTGTVVIFGGDQEITVTDQVADERVAGVISANPAYLMNSSQSGLAVALRGRVPVKVIGPVTKGDSLVTSTTPGVAYSVGRSRSYAQAVFAKALETYEGDGETTIIAVII